MPPPQRHSVTGLSLQTIYPYGDTTSKIQIDESAYRNNTISYGADVFNHRSLNFEPCTVHLLKLSVRVMYDVQKLEHSARFSESGWHDAAASWMISVFYGLSLGQLKRELVSTILYDYISSLAFGGSVQEYHDNKRASGPVFTRIRGALAGFTT